MRQLATRGFYLRLALFAVSCPAQQWPENEPFRSERRGAGAGLGDLV